MKIEPKSVALLGICTAIAMVLSYLESLIPLSFAVPGVKLGLANIAIVFVLYKLGAKEAVLVSALRIIWMAILFGNFLTLAYSAAGAVLSLTAMILLKRSERFSAVGVSVTGGILHNAGQILVAMLVMETAQIVYYLPVLCISGIAAGVAVGIVSAILIKRIPVGRS
ncbi:MAG: Gx transporter family protein [Oscillospiraceae bacterium]|nr:Gx transporter family protein [Oscillospiraceae bacterium]